MRGTKSRVLLVLPQEIVDRARVFAGQAMIALKLPVSLQIVFRALIEQGLKRGGDPALRASVASQATAVHQRRSHDRTPAGRRRPSRREPPTARKWERGRGDAVVTWVVATAWAMVAAVALGCAQPAPALTTPAAPVSAGIATGESAKENVTAGVETSHATEEASLNVAAFYLYVLIRSR